jgi:RNA polymerase sporulation-specific sigma factor
MADINEFTDNELILLCRSPFGGIEAQEIIFERYKGLARKRARQYFSPSCENDDLIQEAMIGLFKAIRDYKEGFSFANFADICVTRQVQSAVKSAQRKKHQPLNKYVPIDSENRAANLHPQSSDKNPEELIITQEEAAKLIGFIRSELSAYEYKALSMHMDGKSYAEIAWVMGKTEKSVDNAIQRARKKTNNIIGWMDKNE